MRRRTCLAILALVGLAGAACSLPPVDLQAERPLSLRSSIVAADGTLLARLGGTRLKNLYCENRAALDIDDIPDVLIDAVLAAEDARFFEHRGFDLRAIARAALVNTREGKVVQGGSTITQQYVKNTFFDDPARTFERKAKELRLAVEVERVYSKKEILERYLNTVYFGNGAYGVKAASETYFGHGLGQLMLPQAALLAALIKAPARYDPRDHPRAAQARRNYVLGRMQQLAHITRRQADQARRLDVHVVEEPPRIATRQPYFVEAVKREVLSDKRLGANEQERTRALCRGGLRIETTLVPGLQKAAERAVAQVLDQPGDPAAALVAIRPSDGEVVAMVGGRDWELSQVNLALGRAGGGSGRQPGSSFKPMVLATALEGGIPLDAKYQSSPATFTFEHGDPWTVRNAEGNGYGLMPLDEAMVHSVNGVYARLALQLGPGQIATQAHLMGVKSRLPQVHSIALGATEVSVLDMAAAYATLANYGTAIEATTIRRVRMANGEVFAPDQEEIPAAVSPGNAYLISKVLQQVIERGTGTAADIGRPAAGKTGTTNNYTDAWFVGYTRDLVAAVWVGYPQGLIPMTSVHGTRVYGGTLPALIWRNFMLQALSGKPVTGFPIPKGELVTLEIDPRTGLLAAPWCPGKKRTMLRQLAPTQYCPATPPSPLITQAPSPGASGASPGPSPSAKKSQQPTSEPKSSPSPTPDEEPSPAPSKTKKGG